MAESLLSAFPKDRICCRIFGVTRTAFLKIWHSSGYPMEHSLNNEIIPDGTLVLNKTLHTEGEFVQEHERLIGVATAIYPSATIETAYYAAGEETPKYICRS